MNPANDWLDGKISAGKMCELLGCERIPTDQVIGAIWQAFKDRHDTFKADIQNAMDVSERLKIQHQHNGEADVAQYESTRRLAFAQCLTKLRFHIGSAIENTSQ